MRVVHRAFDGTFVERQGVFTLYDDSLPQVWCVFKRYGFVVRTPVGELRTAGEPD